MLEGECRGYKPTSVRIAVAMHYLVLSFSTGASIRCPVITRSTADAHLIFFSEAEM
jgi:hypothetical protein